MRFRSVDFLLFPVFFILIYFDIYDVGGVKFGVVWKFSLVLALLIWVVMERVEWSLLPFVGLIYAIKSGINFDVFQNPFGSFVTVGKFLVFPVVFQSTVLIEKYINNFSISFLDKISVYFSLSAMLYIFNLVEANQVGYDLSIYGVDDISGFVGFFQNPHGASFTFSAVAVYLLYRAQVVESSITKFFVYLCSIIVIYCLFKTYARAGWWCFLIGVYFVYFHGRPVSKLLNSMVYFVPVCFALLLFIASDQFFYDRLFDNNVHVQYESVLDSFGSGRLGFALTALDVFFNSSVLDQVIGIGEAELMFQMSNVYGILIVSHNGFVDSLVICGYIGFIIFVSFCFLLVKRSVLFSERNVEYLPVGLTFMYLFMNISQGGNFFYFELYCSVLLGYSYACYRRDLYSK